MLDFKVLVFSVNLTLIDLRESHYFKEPFLRQFLFTSVLNILFYYVISFNIRSAPPFSRDSSCIVPPFCNFLYMFRVPSVIFNSKFLIIAS